MRHLILAIALTLALPAVAVAQDALPAAPAATTGPSDAVMRTGATVSGTVDPNGSPTTYRFEYGTSTAYGSVTTDTTAGDGDDPQAVSTALSGLTPSTTYHYRVVAMSAGGTAQGADRTLRTAANPRLPSVTKTGTTLIGPFGATLRSTLDPNGNPTTYHFEYGRTKSYGSRTPERPAGEGDRGAVVSEGIGDLEPYRRYHLRMVATNEAGTVTSLDRSFVTSRNPTAITLAVDEPRTPWGAGVEVFGRVSGTGAGGIPVGLERLDFPYGGTFIPVTGLPTRTDRSGRFRIYVPNLFSSTRLRAVTRSTVVAVSPTVTANVALRVGIATKRVSRGRVRVRGSVTPAAPQGRAVLQRRTSKGGWTFVHGADLRKLGSSRSRYTFTVARVRKARQFRVRVIARDGGAHVPGTSGKVTVARLPRR